MPQADDSSHEQRCNLPAWGNRGTKSGYAVGKCRFALRATSAISANVAGIQLVAVAFTELHVTDGNLVDQDVEVIVNAWNRNIIPWWLLLPRGVSGAIKRRAGYRPFRELGGKGAIPLGGAVETNAGQLPFRSIIHVAGISMFWRSSERAIRGCVRSALDIARQRGYRSIAFPIIGAGTGGFSPERALDIMRDEARQIDYDGEVRFIRFTRAA